MVDIETSPLISVVIPTYNDAYYLQRCLLSVIDQSYNNWEIIIIDNNSTDNTDEVIASFDSIKIKTIKIFNHGVIAASRNLGIRSARGDWIAFLDSDDFWYLDKLKVSIEAVNANIDTDIFCSNELVFDEATSVSSKLVHGTKSKNLYSSLLVNGNCLSPSAVLINRKILLDKQIMFSENREYIMSEDYDFWLRLAKAGAKFQFIDSILGQYTLHSKNATNRFVLFQKNTLNVVKDHVFNIQDFCIDKNKLWRKVKVKYEIPLGFYMIQNNSYFDGSILIIKTILNSFIASVSFFVKAVIKKYK